MAQIKGVTHSLYTLFTGRGGLNAEPLLPGLVEQVLSPLHRGSQVIPAGVVPTLLHGTVVLPLLQPLLPSSSSGSSPRRAAPLRPLPALLGRTFLLGTRAA